MNQKQMKKNTLGKFTMVLACIFIFIYIVSAIYNIWVINDRFGGWDVLIEMCASVSFIAALKLICSYMVLPVLYTMVYFMFIIMFARNKKFGKKFFVISIVLFSFDAIVFLLSGLIGAFVSVPVFSLITICARIVMLALFLVNISNPIGKKNLIIASAISWGFVSISRILYNLYILETFLQAIKTMQGLELAILCMEYFARPIIEIIFEGFVLGYLIFPEKYCKEEIQ